MEFFPARKNNYAHVSIRVSVTLLHNYSSLLWGVGLHTSSHNTTNSTGKHRIHTYMYVRDLHRDDIMRYDVMDIS